MVSFEYNDNVSYFDDTKYFDDTNNVMNEISNNYEVLIPRRTIIIIIQVFLYMVFVFIGMVIITYVISVQLFRSMMREQCIIQKQF